MQVRLPGALRLAALPRECKDAVEKPPVNVLISWAASGRLKLAHAKRVQTELSRRQAHPMPPVPLFLESEGRHAPAALTTLTATEVAKQLWPEGPPLVSNEELARLLPTLRRPVEKHFRGLAREVADGKSLPFRPTSARRTS